MLPNKDNEIETWFPNLQTQKYNITSSKTLDYNCIAWSVENDRQWWWPDLTYQYYWPEELPRVTRKDYFIKLYRLYGYEICRTDKFEIGYEKIVIFLKSDIPTHVARQLDQEKWTSKLGDSYDISHEISALDGDMYGIPSIFMKRKII